MITLRGSQFYTDFRVNGKRVRRSLDTTDRKTALEQARALKKRAETIGTVDTITLRDAFDRMHREVYSKGRDAKVKKYLTDQLVRLTGGDISLDKITYAWLHDLQLSLIDRGDANGSVNRKMSIISKTLKTALRKWRLLEALPPMPERLPEPKGRLRILTDEEEKRILELTTNEDVRFLWEFLLMTGCRRGEALSLDWSDVNWDNGVVQFHHTKTDEPRGIPVSKYILAKLRERYDAGHKVPFDMKVYTVRYWWNKVRQEMGLMDDKEFIVHALRHTCATRMVERGVDIRIIQQWLGHSVITMTQRYAKATNKALMDLRDRMEEE